MIYNVKKKKKVYSNLRVLVAISTGGFLGFFPTSFSQVLLWFHNHTTFQSSCYVERGAALRLSHSKLHRAAHVHAGALQDEFVDCPVVFQADRGPRFKVLSIQSPNRRLIYGD